VQEIGENCIMNFIILYRDISMRMRWTGHVARMGTIRNVFKV
jgi:hypothetical protein